VERITRRRRIVLLLLFAVAPGGIGVVAKSFGGRLTGVAFVGSGGSCEARSLWYVRLLSSWFVNDLVTLLVTVRGSDVRSYVGSLGGSHSSSTLSKRTVHSQRTPKDITCTPQSVLFLCRSFWGGATICVL
jgi:hypothetical protein